MTVFFVIIELQIYYFLIENSRNLEKSVFYDSIFIKKMYLCAT